MKRYFAPIADIAFVIAAVIIIPATTELLRNAAWSLPSLYFYISVATMVFYPLACMVMLQKMATEEVVRDGIVSLRGFFKRFYGKPLLLVFGGILLFHSTVMAMSLLHGELATGSESLKAIDPSTYAVGAIIGFSIQIPLTLYIIIKLTGFSLKKFRKWRGTSNEPLTPTWMIIYTIFQIIMLPIYVTIGASLIIIAMFYLYCIVWFYAFAKADDGQYIKFFPEGRAAKVVSNGILIVYTVILAFFFDTFIGYSTSYQMGGKTYYADTMDGIVSTGFGMVLFYIPLRIFFGLYSGKSRLGWLTFTLSLVIVFWQNLSRFGGS